MKEDILSDQSSSPQSQTKKQKIDKKRIIRKNKIQNVQTTDSSDSKSHDIVKLTREQKAKIQKAKNRQAAQRSRDTHKDYVNRLENQIKVLRQQTAKSPKICSRCLQQMSSATEQLYLKQISIPYQMSKQQQIFRFAGEQEQHNFANFERNQDIQDSAYLRISSTDQQYSYIKMLLLVCVIVIGAVYFSATKLDNLQPRVLIEVPMIQHSDFDSSIKSTLQLQNRIVIPGKQLVALNSGIDNQHCLDSLMKIEPINTHSRSLRSIHSNSLDMSLASSQSGILLCSLKMPKMYQPNRVKPSSLIRLFVLGSEVKEMITNDLIVPIKDKNIQLNGIYKINAQIKQVSLVTDHTCLL